ncbi:type II toxin-antitoxin system HicB family antitoxin [Oryzicola mucosus]|uniref:Type II toxin-antitoxin system HicB family antitoxin n=1 Tax=Oryzicola mucosus TaxID=2767425 RepID=A0A8J6PPQ5_9HYPH|nr:type II toxin-antitoxin system HicB family antitoxin [Oryzicola mucosus]MBD0416167.1 type II toxin-antitoxin system HicB family antitoxin [Oryzicola mucosus]
MRQYIGLIHKEAHSDFGVSFPDFPGAITAGIDLDDARRMAEEALALHIDGLIEDGEALPEPSTLEQVMNNEQNRSAVAILVAVRTEPRQSVRINITLPKDILTEIDAFAAAHGYTRSGFLAQAAKKAINSEAA